MTEYNFSTYIKKLGDSHTDGLPLYKDTREFLNEKVNYWITQLIRESEDRLGDKKTITESGIEQAIDTLVRVPTGERNKLAMIFKEVGRQYCESDDYKKELIIPYARVEKCAKSNMLYKDTKISKKALIYLLAVVEQLILEFIEAGMDEYNKVKSKHKNLSMKYISIAINNDEELKNI